MRKSSVADAVIVRFDSMLRAAFGVGMHQRRPSPAEGLPESPMSAEVANLSELQPGDGIHQIVMLIIMLGQPSSM